MLRARSCLAVVPRDPSEPYRGVSCCVGIINGDRRRGLWSGFTDLTGKGNTKGRRNCFFGGGCWLCTTRGATGNLIRSISWGRSRPSWAKLGGGRSRGPELIDKFPWPRTIHTVLALAAISPSQAQKGTTRSVQEVRRGETLDGGNVIPTGSLPRLPTAPDVCFSPSTNVKAAMYCCICRGFKIDRTCAVNPTCYIWEYVSTTMHSGHLASSHRRSAHPPCDLMTKRKHVLACVANKGTMQMQCRHEAGWLDRKRERREVCFGPISRPGQVRLSDYQMLWKAYSRPGSVVPSI